MIGPDPPEDGFLQPGVLYRFKVRRRPEREPRPEVLEAMRRAHQRLIREYLEKKRAS